MAPMALGCVWLGGLWFTCLVAVASALMAWEWGKLVGSIRTRGDGIWFAASAAAAVIAGGAPPVSAFGDGLLAAWPGVVLILASILLRRQLAPRRDPLPGWACGGLLWIVLPCIGFVRLRLGAEGLAVCLWLLALTWAVDSGAYAAGRMIGGARLVPRISPNKTWAGLIGGIVAATVVGLIAGLIAAPAGVWWRLAALSGVLAIVEQMGDLAESYAKRRFGAKDSGSLIPGHGGLLDRLDGMLAVVAVVVLVSLLEGGSVVTWH